MSEFEHIDFDKIAVDEFQKHMNSPLPEHYDGVDAWVVEAMKAAIHADREGRIKKKPLSMPVEIIRREEYEDLRDLLTDLKSLFGKMDYNPKATNIISLDNRIGEALEKFRPRTPEQALSTSKTEG